MSDVEMQKRHSGNVDHAVHSRTNGPQYATSTVVIHALQ